MNLRRTRDWLGVFNSYLKTLWQPFWVSCIELFVIVTIVSVVFPYLGLWTNVLLFVTLEGTIFLSMRWWSRNHDRPPLNGTNSTGPL